MRKKLKSIDGERKQFTGIFKRFGKKTGWKGKLEKTVLLTTIKDNTGTNICNHLWFNYTKGFQSLGVLDEGDIIEFQARVVPYIKGYVRISEYIDERTVDYKLSYPTQFKKIISP